MVVCYGMARCVIDPHCDGSSNTGPFKFISADNVIVYVAVIDHVSFVFVFLDSAYSLVTDKLTAAMQIARRAYSLGSHRFAR